MVRVRWLFLLIGAFLAFAVWGLVDKARHESAWNAQAAHADSIAKAAERQIQNQDRVVQALLKDNAKLRAMRQRDSARVDSLLRRPPRVLRVPVPDSGAGPPEVLDVVPRETYDSLATACRASLSSASLDVAGTERIAAARDSIVRLFRQRAAADSVRYGARLASAVQAARSRGRKEGVIGGALLVAGAVYLAGRLR